jgi:hypothetical protein
MWMCFWPRVWLTNPEVEEFGFFSFRFPCRLLSLDSSSWYKVAVFVFGVWASPVFFPMGGGVDGFLRPRGLLRDLVNEEDAPKLVRADAARPVGGSTNLQDVEFERQFLHGPRWVLVLREQRKLVVRHCWQAVYMRSWVAGVSSSSSWSSLLSSGETILPLRLGCELES